MQDRPSVVRRLRIGAVAVLVALAAGCATPPPSGDPEALAAYEEANDPLEPLNRYVFEVNRGLDMLVVRPAAEVYRGLIPEVARDSVRNFLDNLSAPVVLVNDLLQGEVDRAGQTFGRFLANTFIGVGGLFDVVPDIEHHDEDFGQTLAVWGAPEGPYLVLPLLGPSPLRDTIGLVPDFYIDPVSLYAGNTDRRWIRTARFALDGIDTRSRNIESLDDIERTSIDFYATVRSLYRQRRADEIRNGRPGPSAPLLDISTDFEEDDGEDKVSVTARS